MFRVSIKVIGLVLGIHVLQSSPQCTPSAGFLAAPESLIPSGFTHKHTVCGPLSQTVLKYSDCLT